MTLDEFLEEHPELKRPEPEQPPLTKEQLREVWGPDVGSGDGLTNQ